MADDIGADPALVASQSSQSSLSRPFGFDPGDLEKLATRCEQATGADRGLDWACHAAKLGNARPNRDELDEAPKYTASLDAAMTLAPETWEVALYWGVRGFEPEAQLETEEFRLDYPGEPISGKGKTIALALCAAALKARAAIATEARRAGTGNTDPVHEGAGPKGIAQGSSQ